MRSLVIIPTYNEVENLPVILKRVFQDAPEVDVLIVDDASPDGTGALADDFAVKNARVKVFHRKSKDGLGGAYRAGFAWGLRNNYEVMVQLDADGSHPTDAIVKLIAALAEFDVAIGSRWVSGGSVVNWPLHRKILSRGGNLYARLMLRLPIKDATAGFRAFRAEALVNSGLLETESQGYVFQVESSLLIARKHLKVVELPITFVEREIGTSKMSQKIVLEAMLSVTKWAFSGR
jgi:dolichol-phosphate mannosyltransferase